MEGMWHARSARVRAGRGGRTVTDGETVCACGRVRARARVCACLRVRVRACCVYPTNFRETSYGDSIQNIKPSARTHRPLFP